MTRDVSSTIISGSSIYSYTEVNDWTVGPTSCTYSQVGGVTSPFGWNITATSQLQWWESGTWHDYATAGTGNFTGYGDKELCSTTDSFGRAATDRTVSLGCLTTVSGNSQRAWIDYTVPHLPDAPTSLTATRVSDNKVSLSWTAPSRDYEAMCIERSVDGGSYSEVAVLWNTATSWDDTATAADHAYTYRLRAYYQYAYSDYTAATASIAMTPSAPQSMTTAASGGTNIDVTVVNPSPVATVLQYAVSTDGGSTWGTTQDSASLTSFTVSASGSGIKIRVRNKNATGTSDWLVSGTITTICRPDKPTITSPQSNVWDVSQPLVVSWIHNPLDGSAQTAAKILLVKDATPPVSHTETYDPFTGNSKSISLATAQSWVTGLVVGDTLNVAVKTKGADASYSGNSVARGILLAQAPTVNITSPASSITAMPLSITATYTDNSGTCAEANYYLAGNGQRYPQSGTLPMTVTTSGGVTTLSASLTASDFILANGESYTVYVTARSSSSLQYTANATFTTAFTEPTAGDLSMQNDADTGYVSLLATFDNDGSDIEYSGNTNTQYDCEPAYVKSLTVEGQSAKWNQLVKYPKNANNWLISNSTNGATTTSISNNALVLTSASASDSTSMLIIRAAMEPITNGHKYFMAVDASSNQMLARFNLLDGWTTIKSGADVNGLKADILTATADGTSSPYFSITTKPNDASFSHPVGSTVTFYGFACVDLTAIFGSGNEPTTVDAFKATDIYKAKLAAGELYDYDAGSLVSIGSNLQAWNQLFDNSAPSENVNGADFTNNGDGTWNVTGDWSSTPYKYAGSAPCDINHKLLVMQATNPSNAYLQIGFDCCEGSTWKHTMLASGATSILTIPSYIEMDNIKPFIVISPGWVSTDNIKVTPRIIDLTAIYGAGNEPTSTSDARVTALTSYAATHYQKVVGGVMEGNTGGVVVTGRNLLRDSEAMGASWYKAANASVSDGVAILTEPSTLDWNSVLGSSYVPFSELNGKSVAVSFEYKASTNISGYVDITASSRMPSQNTDNTRTKYQTKQETFAAASEWTRYTWDFGTLTEAALQSGSGEVNSIFVRIYNRTASSTLQVRHMQLEIADTAHAYEPYRMTPIPATLRSAGSVHDQLQAGKDSWTVARKVGYVDLGSINWTYTSGDHSRFVGYLDNYKKPSSDLGMPNAICAKYTVDALQHIYDHITDKTIGFHHTAYAVWVYDSTAGTDAATFKTAMSGVYLFYELATPTTDTATSYSTIQLGTAFTVGTELDSTFEMTSWDGAAEAVSISVSRVNADGTTTPLLTDGASGSGVVDKYAPLNTPYQYAVTTTSAAKAIKTVYVDNIIETDRWFAYWGENVASAKWNPDNGGIQLQRPQKVRVFYAGRKDPVSYDGSAVSLTETPSWVLVDRAEVQPFVQLIEDGGRGVYKSCDGWVYHADFDLTLTPKYIAIGYYGGVGLTITRIAGDLL